MHLAPLIRDLGVLLVTAGLSAIVFRRIGQPVVLGYLLVGVAAGPHTPPFSWVTDLKGIQIWADLGVIILMFSLGLEFSFERLAGLGITPIITGVFEALFMFVLGFGAGMISAWNVTDSAFLGAILSVSSTAIIVKALDDLGYMRRPFAELVLGSLIMDDLMGILFLAVLTSLVGEPVGSRTSFIFGLVKLLVSVGAWIGVGHFILRPIVNRLGRISDSESLTLLSLGLCLALVVASVALRLSPAFGAFLMGSILAGTTQFHRIVEAIRPLRDVFGSIFFVATGMLLNPADIVTHWRLIAVVTALTIAGKVVGVYLGGRTSGQSRRISLQMGFSMAQIGEFSFIIASAGLSLGTMRPELYPAAVAAAILTTFTTPYLIRLSGRISGGRHPTETSRNRSAA